MDLFALTRALVDIESITGNEKGVSMFVLERLQEMAARHGGRAEPIAVAPNRFNVFAHWGEPVVTLSTHLDTVPPFFASAEDDTCIRGRGSCDAKGILAAMMAAAEKLLSGGVRNFGLLFLVGEERNSAGAIAAADTPRGSRFLINGEPTENKLAIGSKGALRYLLSARGRMAHSAYPDLGESAIDKLLDALVEIRRIPLPRDPVLGPCTLNIGTLCGGRAPNVVSDSAEAEIMIRIVGDAAPLREAVARAAGRVEAKEVLHTPAMRLGEFSGLPTTIVSFTTAIPFLGGAWGKAFLIGPGSIHAAHTEDEAVPKAQLIEAVGIYTQMVRQLLAQGGPGTNGGSNGVS
jgi:acetylornithine deacetylase